MAFATVLSAAICISGAKGALPLGWDIGSRSPDFSALFLSGSPGVETATHWHAELGKADIYVVSTCAMWCAPCQQFAQQADAMVQTLAAEGISVEFYDFIFQDPAFQEPDAADAQVWINSVWSSDPENVWYGGQIAESDPNSVIADIFEALQNAGGSGSAIPSIVVMDRNLVVRELKEGFTKVQLENSIRSVFAASNLTSIDYAIRPESFASGQPQLPSASMSYTIDTAFDPAGGSVAVSSSYTNKPGYIGQLYDVESISLNGSLLAINEESSRNLRELNAVALLDDSSTLSLRPHEVLWSPVSGPLVGIDFLGVATADAVFEDTLAVAQASFFGGNALLDLLVVNIEADNFGGYAGDGLDDGWQVGFFGLPPNADAGPGMNPDHDPFNNRFEFLTGYDPTDGSDFFRFRITDRSGSNATIELSKIIPGTRYSMERSTDLGQADPWFSFTSITTLTETADHEVVDTTSSGTIQFYRIFVEPDPELEGDRSD